MKIDTLAALKGFVGREIGVSDWLEMTQDRIDKFADATGDRQWIHVDPERARRESPYGETIAHGFLTLSLLTGFLHEVVELGGIRMAINYGLNRVRFPAAVRAGARIRARVALQSARDVADVVEATYTVNVECEGSDKPCCVAEWVARYYAT